MAMEREGVREKRGSRREGRQEMTRGKCNGGTEVQGWEGERWEHREAGEREECPYGKQQEKASERRREMGTEKGKRREANREGRWLIARRLAVCCSLVGGVCFAD